MKINQDLAFLKERHKKFRALMRGIDSDSLSPLSDSQREVLKDTAYKLHRDIRNIKRELSDSVVEEGSVEFKAAPGLIRYYRENLVDDEDLIAAIFEKTDPHLFDLFRMLDSPGRLVLGHVYKTFEDGLKKISELCEEYPEFKDDYYMVDHAWDVVGSKLIRFNPDKWIKNSGLLQPIMTDKKQSLPLHVRKRLVELYRSFIFENWLSVISLSRATLEYAILDNCHKWNIKSTRKVKYSDGNVPKEREQFKDLKTLIDEISEHDNELSNLMNFIRRKGNEVAHPKKTDGSWEKSPAGEYVAKECIEKLIHAVEFLYLPKKMICRRKCRFNSVKVEDLCQQY